MAGCTLSGGRDALSDLLARAVRQPVLSRCGSVVCRGIASDIESHDWACGERARDLGKASSDEHRHRAGIERGAAHASGCQGLHVYRMTLDRRGTMTAGERHGGVEQG